MFAEPTESANLVLSNLQVVCCGPTTVPPTSSATTSRIPAVLFVKPVSIVFFVRQHYHDFLNREPDAAESPSDEPNRLAETLNAGNQEAQCPAAFFLSIDSRDHALLSELKQPLAILLAERFSACAVNSI